MSEQERHSAALSKLDRFLRVQITWLINLLIQQMFLNHVLLCWNTCDSKDRGRDRYQPDSRNRFKTYKGYMCSRQHLIKEAALAWEARKVSLVRETSWGAPRISPCGIGQLQQRSQPVAGSSGIATTLQNRSEFRLSGLGICYQLPAFLSPPMHQIVDVGAHRQLPGDSSVSVSLQLSQQLGE